MSDPRQVAAVLFVHRSGRVLLRLRDARPDLPFPDQWDLVGGAVEAGETIEQAARREVKEEIGIDVAQMKYFGEYLGLAPTHVFVAPLSVPLERLVLTEGQRLEYVNAEEASTRALVPWVVQLLGDFFGQRREQ